MTEGKQIAELLIAEVATRTPGILADGLIVGIHHSKGTKAPFVIPVLTGDWNLVSCIRSECTQGWDLVYKFHMVEVYFIAAEDENGVKHEIAGSRTQDVKKLRGDVAILKTLFPLDSSGVHSYFSIREVK